MHRGQHGEIAEVSRLPLAALTSECSATLTASNHPSLKPFRRFLRSLRWYKTGSGRERWLPKKGALDSHAHAADGPLLCTCGNSFPSFFSLRRLSPSSGIRAWLTAQHANRVTTAAATSASTTFAVSRRLRQRLAKRAGGESSRAAFDAPAHTSPFCHVPYRVYLTSEPPPSLFAIIFPFRAAVDACGEAGGSFVDIGDSVCNPGAYRSKVFRGRPVGSLPFFGVII